MKRILLIFTRLFDPFAVFCVGYLAIFYKFGSFPQDFSYLILLILINIVIPLFYFINLLKLKKIGNWDITKKEERQRLIGPLVIFILFTTIVLYVFSCFAVLSPRTAALFDYLIRFQGAGLLLFSYLFFISPFFKSSGHVGVMSMVFPFILKMFGIQLSWVIILIGIQAAARVKLGKHTWGEVIAGFVSGIAIGAVATLFP